MFFVVPVSLVVAGGIVFGLVALAFFDVGFARPSAALEGVWKARTATAGGKQAAGSTGQGAPACSGCWSRVIGVTPPEVFAIVELLRRTQPHRTVQWVHARAGAGALQAARLTRAAYGATVVECPLHDENNVCLAFAARPLRCRGLRDRTALAEIGSDATETSTDEPIVRGLSAAGLEASSYELNGALVAALDTDIAASRWARGEAVFQNCTVLV